MNIPEKMPGVWLTGHGGPEKLVYKKDIPVPSPEKGDVLVKVSAAGVNNTDINTRTAWYSKQDRSGDDASWSGEPIQFPRIQGIDVCGTIAGVGEGVSSMRIGERVLIEPCLRYKAGKLLKHPIFLGSECDGGFARFTVVPACHAYKIKSSYSDTQLASFPCSYSTAENLLTRSNVRKGESILVTGASGGVGSAAVQLACARQARVSAVTTPSKFQSVKNLGVEHVVARDTDLLKELGKDRFDVVIDLVAGSSWPQLLDILKPGGRYAAAGAVAGPIVELDIRTLYLKDLTLLGCTALDPGVFQTLVKVIEEEKITPLVAAVFDLPDIHKAQEMFARKDYTGKIVLNLES